jgi:hypothetical protein
MTALLAIAAVSCTQTDQRPTQATAMAVASRADCVNTMAERPSDDCSAKTMAGQRPHPSRGAARL